MTVMTHFALEPGLENICLAFTALGAMQGALGIKLRLELSGMLDSCLLQVHGVWDLEIPVNIELLTSCFIFLMHCARTTFSSLQPCLLGASGRLPA